MFQTAPWSPSHWLGVNVWYREAKAVFEPTEPQAPKTEEPEYRQRPHHGDKETMNHEK